MHKGPRQHLNLATPHTTQGQNKQIAQMKIHTRTIMYNGEFAKTCIMARVIRDHNNLDVSRGEFLCIKVRLPAHKLAVFLSPRFLHAIGKLF